MWQMHHSQFLLSLHFKPRCVIPELPVSPKHTSSAHGTPGSHTRQRSMNTSPPGFVRGPSMISSSPMSPNAASISNMLPSPKHVSPGGTLSIPTEPSGGIVSPLLLPQSANHADVLTLPSPEDLTPLSPHVSLRDSVLLRYQVRKCVFSCAIVLSPRPN